MKKCPYCAEEIQDEAIVCKHCGRELAPDAVAITSQSLVAQSGKSEVVPPFLETDDAPMEVPDDPGTQVEATIPPGSTEGAPLESPTRIPIYRRDWFYVLLLVFVWPLFVVLVLTDRNAHILFKVLAWIEALLILAVVGIVVLALFGPVLFESPPEILFSSDETSSVPTQIVQAQADQRVVTSAPLSLQSEQELFWEYDAKLGEWLDELLLIDDKPQGQYVVTASGRHWSNKFVRDEMQIYDPPPNLRTQHAIFTSYVAELILADRALDLNPPDEAEWQRLFLRSQILLHDALEDYADYGASLGYEIWPRICAEIPDHARC